MSGAKPVLLDIFSYSCMNCQRSLEHIKRLSDKYSKFGLFTAIIHPPEWEFEKNNGNIRNATKKYGIKFPLITDKKRKITKSLRVDFWPSQILLKGRKIIYRHIGEGNYKELEKAILNVLKLKGNNKKALFENEPKYSKFPTVYLGSKKHGRVICNKNFRDKLKFGTVYAGGNWVQKDEFLDSNNEGTLSFLANGKKVYAVAESKGRDGAMISISANGKFLKNMQIKAPDLYCIAEFKDAKEHILNLECKSGIAVYSFSFD